MSRKKTHPTAPPGRGRFASYAFGLADGTKPTDHVIPGRVRYQDPTRERYVENRRPMMCRLCSYVPRRPGLALTDDGICRAAKSCARRQREDPLTEAEKRLLWGDR